MLEKKSGKPFTSPEGAVTKETLLHVISYLYLYNMEKENISVYNLSYIEHYDVKRIRIMSINVLRL